MDYPFFEVPRLGGGMLIGIVAIVHVFLAHFAVGAGFLLAVGHTVAVRRADPVLLRFLRDLAGLLAVLAFVAGAVTGVGIWTTISLVSPPATSLLIHNFVWGWATEYVFFIVEIAAGYVYYYGWGRLTPGRQQAAAWIYAFSAFMSLVIINGILTFMLTPGEWVARRMAGQLSGEQAFWVGWLNPTMLPSMLLRTVSALAIAAIFAALLVNYKSQYTREERHHVIRFASYFLVPLGLMVPLAIWYFLRLPPAARELPLGGAIAMTLFLVFGLVASIMIGFYAYLGLIRRGRYINRETSWLLLGTAFVATASMEFVREGIRKPYLIYDFLYSNGILATPARAAEINRGGILANARFSHPPGPSPREWSEPPPVTRGRFVYNAECRMCHEPGGTNAIESIVPGAGRDWVRLTTQQLNRVRRYMPPFLGTPDELEALVDYQMELLAGGRRTAATRPAQEVAQ